MKKKKKYKVSDKTAEEIIRGEKIEVTDARDLTQNEMSGEKKDVSDLGLSETDENENEGSGDGNIGRSAGDR